MSKAGALVNARPIQAGAVGTRCNVCGVSIRGASAHPSGRCTNRRCGVCHASFCEGGGNTAPGHGLGRSAPRNLEDARPEGCAT